MRMGTWLERSLKVVAVLVALGAGACGSSSSSELCHQSIEATCDKIFTCAEGEPARADVGGSKSACVSDMGIFCVGAASATCPSGKSYHADKAQQCLDETKSASCASSFDSSGFAISPAACSQVCS